MLRPEPPQIRAVHHDLRRLVLPTPTLAQRLQQPLGGEHRHLRTVGDRALATVRDIEALDAPLTVALANLRATQELDRRAEGVAERAAEEAAAEGCPRRRHRYGLPAYFRDMTGTEGAVWQKCQTAPSTRTPA